MAYRRTCTGVSGRAGRRGPGRRALSASSGRSRAELPAGCKDTRQIKLKQDNYCIHFVIHLYKIYWFT